MKNKLHIAGWILAGSMICSCSDTWDEHYVQQEAAINNTDIVFVNKSVVNYLSEEPALAATYQLFEKTGMIERMQAKESTYTIIAVEEGVTDARVQDGVTADDIYKAETYISDISLSPSNLTERIFMWSGKYLDVTKTENTEGGTTIMFNNAEVTKVVKLDNGYLYYVNEEIVSPRSMYEKLIGLSDDYSIFRELVRKRFTEVFDKKNSMVIGVDQTGNTIYDSVFITTAPYFEENGLEIMSESASATILVPSNAVIEAARAEAKAKLKEWDMTREDTILDNWILQSAFFDQKLTKQDFADNEDLTSVFKKQWRTTAQQVNLDAPESLSNGVIYYVNKLKFPTNVLIYRIKDHFFHYEKLDSIDKDSYFVRENLVYKETKKTGPNSGLGWPQAGYPNLDYYYSLRFNLEDADTKKSQLDFTALKYSDEPSDGKQYTATAYVIPPGEYDLCLGLEQGKNNRLGSIAIYVNDSATPIKTLSDKDTSSANYHFDRNGDNGPEGFDTKAAVAAGNKNAGKYDRDGKSIGKIVLEEAGPLKLRFVSSGSSLTGLWLYHWCLRPTKNNY